MSLTYAQKMALGAKRATYRRRLQEVLDAQGLSGAALARQLGISSVAVYRTLSGQLHSPKVLDWLRAHGAPENTCVIPEPLITNRKIRRDHHCHHIQHAGAGTLFRNYR